MDTPQTRRSFYYYSELQVKYSTDTPRTRWSFYYSFRSLIQIQYGYTPDTEVILLLIQNSKVQIQYRYTPDTEVILLLIQISYSDTIWIHSIHGSHYLEFIPVYRDGRGVY